MRDFILEALIPGVFVVTGLYGLLFMVAYHIDKTTCTAYGEKLNIETDYDYQCFIKDNGAWKLKPVASQEGE